MYGKRMSFHPPTPTQKQIVSELCPPDTTLFDNSCYWSGDASLPSEASDDVCAERGGRLAAFPSQNAIEFVGNVWLVQL